MFKFFLHTLTSFKSFNKINFHDRQFTTFLLDEVCRRSAFCPYIVLSIDFVNEGPFFIYSINQTCRSIQMAKGHLEYRQIRVPPRKRTRRIRQILRAIRLAGCIACLAYRDRVVGVGYRYLKSTNDVSRLAHQETTGCSAAAASCEHRHRSYTQDVAFPPFVF